MGIKISESKLHWNYYLALERDMDKVSRFIEFSKPNMKTYSIELAHLLFAAASEVDVVCKSLCKLLDDNCKRGNIVDYRAVITANLKEFSKEKAYAPRHGLQLDPWSSWRTRNEKSNPVWWKANTQVKHYRNEHFRHATLMNALNALAGLHICVFHYYKQLLTGEMGEIPRNKDVNLELRPEPQLIFLKDEYYVSTVVI
ncbi:MAG: hypothetical protein IPM50_01780 [Acidobacteriota bacterium]|nr:MAG: hypothetical protein IPM50_01780 [Acidobacteriota bacterium]